MRLRTSKRYFVGPRGTEKGSQAEPRYLRNEEAGRSCTAFRQKAPTLIRLTLFVYGLKTVPPSARGDALELGKVIEVVTGHGFNDGLKGHGATLGMGNGLGR
jgi:hypothetical protein